jgi:signal transduction histidine kinase
LRNSVLKYRNLATQNAIFAAIGQSTSHIAHDMRSPLSVLKTFVQFAKCGEDKDLIELEQAAKNSVNRLNDMADEMLDYSKATQIDKTNININNIINESVRSAKINAGKKGIDVIYTKELENAQINTDSYRMSRVITNIINNAVQAIETKEGKVEILADKNEKEVEIKIKDNGKGMPKEHLPKIFDAFFSKGKQGGTGLGLSYCKQVVEAHGGEIMAKSEFGKGTEFIIKLPA